MAGALIALAIVMALCVTAFSQEPPTVSATNPAEELQSRLQVAATAQQSGDPEAVAHANGRVIALALSQMAELRLMQGALPVAVELYKRSLVFEEAPATHLWLAIAYMRAGQTDDALKETDRLVEVDPKNAAAWNLQGKLWMAKKDYAKASEALGKSLALQTDLEVAYTMATALLNQHEVEKAAAVFKEMDEVAKDRAPMHVLAGRAYERAAMPEDAEREYKKAIEIDPKSSRGHYFLGLFYLTKNGWEPTPLARQEFLAEVAENPTDFFGNYFMGYLTSNEKNYDESDRYLKVAAKSKPDWPEPYLYMGLNAYGRGDSKSAEPLLRKAIDNTGKDEARNNYQVRRAYFTLGRILVQSGRKDEGTKYVQRSREIETKLVVNDRKQQALDSGMAAPGAATAGADQSNAPAVAMTTVSDPAAPVDPATLAAANLSAADKAKSQAAEGQLRGILGAAFNDLGASEARRKEYELALTHFRAAKSWNPQTPGLMRNIGLAAFLSKNYGESAEALKVVVEQDPSDQRSQSMLALSLFSTKNYAEAVKVFERVAEVAEGDPRMAYAWAVSLARTNDRRHASEVLEKLIAQPVPAEMIVMAGQVYADIGDQEHAQICFKKAKEQDPSISLP